MLRKISILGTGVFKPKREVAADELDQRLGLKPGTTMTMSGVKQRWYVEGESAAEMGARAAESALLDAGLSMKDIGAIISVGNTRDQPLPGMGPAYKRLLCDDSHPIPAFDINAVCLGFVVGLDTVSSLLETGRFEKVLLIASEVTSIGVNWQHTESACLFGDGAVAIVVGRSEGGAGILASRMETYASSFHLCEARGGGILNPPWNYTAETDSEYRFSMDGRNLFKQAAVVLPGLIRRVLSDAGLELDELQLVIPHQASKSALRLMPRRLGIPEAKFFVNVESGGNLVAASIPTALHEATRSGRLKRGERCMLLGTSAGISVAAMILQY